MDTELERCVENILEWASDLEYDASQIRDAVERKDFDAVNGYFADAQSAAKAGMSDSETAFNAS